MLDMDIRRSRLIVVIAVTILAGCDGPSKSRDENATPMEAPDSGRTPADNGVSDGIQPSRPVDSETLPYADVEKQLAYGYFAFPSDMVEPLPAVVLVHDWWGLNDDARAAANRLAAEGYMVLAVDLYGGEVVTNASAARDRTITVLEDPEAIEENIGQAIDFVEEFAGAPATGIVGWGFGGSWALQSAALFPERIDAAVVIYGQVSDDESRLSAIDAPVLAIFGGADRSISPESIGSFEAAMERLGNPLELEVYPDAGHAFADPARSKYDPGVAEQAWQRMLDFFTQSLASANRTGESR